MCDPKHKNKIKENIYKMSIKLVFTWNYPAVKLNNFYEFHYNLNGLQSFKRNLMNYYL